MKTIFNKTLVAASVLAFAGAAQAATLVGTEHSVTAPYLAGTVAVGGATDGTFHRAAAVVLTLQAEYTQNDTITLTSTADFGATWPATLTAAPNAGANRLGVTFSRISGGDVNDKTVTYRLTATDTTGLAANPVTTGVTLNIPASVLEFKKAKLSAGASLSFSAKTNTNLDLDTGGGAQRTASLVKVVNQFTTTAPALSKTIDVNADRKDFVSSNEEVTNNTQLVEGVFNIVSLTTGGNDFARPITKVVHTVHGDFSWIRDTQTGTPGIQPAANVFKVYNCGGNAADTVTVTATAVSFECNAVAANTRFELNAALNKAAFAANAQPAIPAQELKVSSEVTYSGDVATAKVWDNAAAGTWALNGATIRVPYMVFGTVGGKAYNQSIILNNTSASAGDVFVDVFAEDGTQILSNTKLATGISARANRNIAGDIIAALPADKKSGKYSLRIVANSPANQTGLYTAFVDTVTGERIIVPNDAAVQTKANN